MKQLIIFLFSFLFMHVSYSQGTCSNQKYAQLLTFSAVDIMDSINSNDLRPRLYFAYESSHDGDYETLILPEKESLSVAAMTKLSALKKSKITWYVLVWISESHDRLFYDDSNHDVYVKLNSGLLNETNGFDGYFNFTEFSSGQYPDVKPLGCGLNLLNLN
jgi:hypothetical protein